MTTNSTCNICGRPFYPDHDATEPGPTVRHPFSPPVATHPVPDSGEPTDSRELLGRWVRQVWVRWASEQDDPKPSWLLGWVELDDGQREVDMRIGEALFEAGRAFAVSGRPSPAVGGANEAVLAWSRAEQRDIESARDDYRSADWRAGAVDSHIQFRNAIIAGKIAITPAVGGDQTTTAEQDILDVIGERDRAEEWADRLAAALAPADVIGEHSNGNNPWANALEWAARKDSLVDDLEREQTARVNAQGDLRVVAEEFPVVPGSPDQVLFAVRALLWLHAEAAARLVEIGQALSGVDFGDHTDCSLVEKIRMLRGNLDNLRAEYFHREREMARAALSGGDQ